MELIRVTKNEAGYNLQAFGCCSIDRRRLMIMKVNEMDKYHVTERVKMLKRILEDPNTQISHFPMDVYVEVKNPVTDKDGFVHKYYLSDKTKDFIEMLIEKD